MAIKLAVVSGKGGVGKSTVCKNLGIQFALSGKRTLLADGDAGLSSLDIMLGCSENITFTWHDYITGRCSADDAIYKLTEELHLLPSPKIPLTEDFSDGISQIVTEKQDEYDIIIIDAPAGLGRGLRRAARASDRAIIVATADEVSVKGAAAVDRVLADEGITRTRLLINRYQLKAAKKGKLLTVDEIIDKTLVQLIGIIPEDENIIYSTVSGKKLKTKLSDKAFSRVAKRITGENVELSLSQLK